MQIFFILYFQIFFTSLGEDLQVIANQVPTDAIDKEIILLVKKEIGSQTQITASYYSLAKFVDINDLVPNNYWYILDGYFVLSTGEITMLDFIYNPTTQSRRPIRNYPTELGRLLLGSKHICNPYERYWLHDPSMTVSRSLSGEEGIEIIYINVKDCPYTLDIRKN